ncbi:OsmC family protein [Nocardioides aestuarii]|uniref:OsmC family protein n=1 Tax=Nocardioides aestuarii TaxID=252231 RepID=A0ABW4TR47_9ACTN
MTTTPTTTATAPVDNGVDVQALLGARAALADTPEIAQFQWRSSVTWVQGTHSRSTIEGFYGFGDEQAHHTSFTLDADHPEQFSARDNGPTPVEYVLVALGACLTAGVAAVAQQRQIQLHSVTATIAAEMDLHGILGADAAVRNGFSGVSVSYQIEADATDDELRALLAQSQKRSAVFDIMTNPTDVKVDLVR